MLTASPVTTTYERRLQTTQRSPPSEGRPDPGEDIAGFLYSREELGFGCLLLSEDAILLQGKLRFGTDTLGIKESIDILGAVLGNKLLHAPSGDSG